QVENCPPQHPTPKRKERTMSVKISEVKMTDGTQRVKVESPYHPDFPAKAKALNGEWNGMKKVWYFDPRTLPAVRTLVKDVYGMDPLATDSEPMVTVRIPVENDRRVDSKDWTDLGRILLSRPG